MTTIPFVNRQIKERETKPLSNFNQVLFNQEFTHIIHCPITIQGYFCVPETVESIGIEAFARCRGLTKLFIPDSVKSIGCYAFSDCTELQTIHLQSNVPVKLNSDSGVFQNVDKSTCVLYVPNGAKPQYQVAESWNEFENICEISEKIETNSRVYKLETPIKLYKIN